MTTSLRAGDSRLQVQARFVAALRNALGERRALHVTKRYPASYDAAGQPQWLPPTAEFELRVALDAPPAPSWREIVLTVRSGPDELYRYYPFCSCVYVGDEQAAILEFDGPWTERTARFTVPCGRPVILTLVTELFDMPARHEAGGDERELALELVAIERGAPVAAPPRARRPAPGRASQQSFPIASEVTRPIFVIGPYRSGTSVLTWAIGQHPNIWPIEETGWLAHFGHGALAGFRTASEAQRSYFDVYDVSLHEYMAHLGNAMGEFVRVSSLRRAQHVSLIRLSGKTERFGEHFSERFQLARTAFNPKRRWVDGTPEYTNFTLLLRALFPAVRFVWVLRDPVDVVSSMLYFDRAGGNATTAQSAAEMWTAFTRIALLSYRAFGPEVVHAVRHDSLISDGEQALAEIFDFLEEARFPTSARTLDERINSSRVGSDEREAIATELLAESHSLDALWSLHDAALQTIRGPWRYDASAYDELQDIQNDISQRLLQALS